MSSPKIIFFKYQKFKMMNLKVKVCGMREKYNIVGLRQLPVDFIGLIFYEKSPRFLEEKKSDLSYLKDAIQRFGNPNEFIKKVGVFVDAPIEFVISKVKQYNLDFVQLHGNENVFLLRSLEKGRNKNHQGIFRGQAFFIYQYRSFSVLLRLLFI